MIYERSQRHGVLRHVDSVSARFFTSIHSKFLKLSVRILIEPSKTPFLSRGKKSLHFST
jgi:hypothetical protein